MSAAPHNPAGACDCDWCIHWLEEKVKRLVQYHGPAAVLAAVEKATRVEEVCDDEVASARFIAAAAEVGQRRVDEVIRKESESAGDSRPAKRGQS